MPDSHLDSVDNASCFSFLDLLNRVKADLKKKYPNLESKPFYEIMEKEIRSFTLNGQSFDYHIRPNHLGGYRWYVLCPKCGKPCYKLYLPNLDKNREQKYYCKFCHKLKNMCMLLGGTIKYKNVIKPLRTLEKLKKDLLSPNMTPEKSKPLLEEYERIKRELENSPDYKLWRFQEENAIRAAKS